MGYLSSALNHASKKQTALNCLNEMRALVEADNPDLEAAGLPYKFVGSIEPITDLDTGTSYNFLVIGKVPVHSDMPGVTVGSIGLIPDENGDPAKFVINPEITVEGSSGGSILEEDGSTVSLQDKAHMEVQMTLLYAMGDADQQKLTAFYDSRASKPAQQITSGHCSLGALTPPLGGM